jgi:hypothetical protein
MNTLVLQVGHCVSRPIMITSILIKFKIHDTYFLWYLFSIWGETRGEMAEHNLSHVLSSYMLCSEHEYRNIPWCPVEAFLSLACFSRIPLLFFKTGFLCSSTIYVTLLQLSNIWTKSASKMYKWNLIEYNQQFCLSEDEKCTVHSKAVFSPAVCRTQPVPHTLFHFIKRHGK